MVMPTIGECRHCQLPWFACVDLKRRTERTCCTRCIHKSKDCVGRETFVTNTTGIDALTDTLMTMIKEGEGEDGSR